MSLIKDSKGRQIHIARLNFVLSEFDSQGYPANINYDPTGPKGNKNLKKTLSKEFIDDVNSILPERIPLPSAHPNWLKDSDMHIIRDGTTVDISFVDEGAGYTNTFGYYVYNTAFPPKSVTEIKSIFVVFPNASKQGGGGSLKAGDTARLSSEHTYTLSNGRYMAAPTSYEFKAGQSIGFVIFPNGWRSYKQSPNRDTVKYYSSSEFNPEKTGEKRYHTVNVRSEVDPTRIIVGFEDLNRDGNSDDDFNDLILFATVNPAGGVDDSTINDKKVNSAKGTLVCDDQIKKESYVDNDYSDLISEYYMKETYSGKYIKEIDMVLHFKHRSAMFDHKFGFIIPNISKCDVSCKRETFIGKSQVSVIEDIKPTDKDEIILSDSTMKLLPASGNSKYYANTVYGWNTDANRTDCSSIKCKITFNKEVTSDDLENVSMPYFPILNVYPSGSTEKGRYYQIKYGELYDSTNNLNLTKKVPKILNLKDKLNYQCARDYYPMIEAYPRFARYLEYNEQRAKRWYRRTRDRYLNDLLPIIERKWNI